MIQLCGHFAAATVSAAVLACRQGKKNFMQEQQNRGELPADSSYTQRRSASARPNTHHYAQLLREGHITRGMLVSWANRHSAHTCDCRGLGSLALLGEQHAPVGVHEVVLQSTEICESAAATQHAMPGWW